MTFFLIFLYYIIIGDMMKRFKPKRRLKKNVFRNMFIIFLLLVILFKITKKVFFESYQDNILNLMINDRNYSYLKKEEQSIFSKAYEYAKQNIINKPGNMLVDYIEYKNEKEHKTKKEVVKESDVLQNKVEEVSKNPSNSSSEPLVYIYSSHQKEGYSMDNMEDYNVVPDVFLASHIMQEKLDNIGIKTIVLENDITAYLNDNKLDYSYSYVASRHFLKDDLNKYPTVKLFIDLHRDATTKEASTVVINNKSYAKIMFVVGMEYDTYEKNLHTVNLINDKIKKLYPTLTRGIMKKAGIGVNGVYNQDLKDNIILIELGGNNNNLDEVVNTIELLVPIIGEYINET